MTAPRSTVFRSLRATTASAAARAAVVLAVFLLMPSAASWSQGPSLPDEDTTPAEKLSMADTLNRPGDITLRNMSLSGALYTISEQWGINIVSGSVSGEVNGVFKDAPLREILDAILLSNGYSYRQVGESLVVSPLSEIGKMNPFFTTATIRVKDADVNEVVEGAKLLSTPQGQIHAIPSASSVLVVDFPRQVDAIKEFVTGIDDATRRMRNPMAGRTELRPLEVAYFRTQFVPADSAKLALEAIKSKEGRIAVLQKESRLLMVDYSENLSMAKLVLERVDRPRPQVRVRSLIYDLSLQDIEELGINWNSGVGRTLDAEGNESNIFTVDSVMKVPFQQGATGSALTFMNLSRNFNIDSVILALQNAKDSRLLADPNVLVMENEEAILQSVEEIPYQQLTETQAGGQIGTTAFKEAGITLRVQPKIAADGTIEMKVSPEFSTLKGFTPGENQPIIDKRIATTTLRIANCQTVVIGGLRQRSDVGDFRGIPYLKDMKYVGKLFRARETDIRESELVVFMCPEIVGYSDPPSIRRQMIADTIGCRLDQIPGAESCGWAGDTCPPGVTCEVDGTVIEEKVEHIPPPPEGSPTPIPSVMDQIQDAPAAPKDGPALRKDAPVPRPIQDARNTNPPAPVDGTFAMQHEASSSSAPGADNREAESDGPVELKVDLASFSPGAQKTLPEIPWGQIYAPPSLSPQPNLKQAGPSEELPKKTSQRTSGKRAWQRSKTRPEESPKAAAEPKQSQETAPEDTLDRHRSVWRVVSPN